MIIRIGDNITLGGNSKYQLTPGIEGLATPDIRMGDGLYAGVDGGYVSSQLYGTRTITIPGFYIASTCEEADNLRLNLLTNLRIRKLHPIFLTTPSGRHYFIEGFVSDIKCDMTNPKAGEFQISFLCTDPIIYDGGNGNDVNSAWVEQTFTKDKAGGFKIEYDTPVPWTSGEQTTFIDNRGTMATYPVITFRGIVHSPTVYNTTTGEYMQVNYTTVSSSDIMLIDMYERIITVNGVSVASYKSSGSTWWKLQPGANYIRYTTTSTSDVDYGIIKYKQGYEGI